MRNLDGIEFSGAGDDRIGLDFLMNMLPVTPYLAVMEFEKFELKSLRFLDPFDKGENV